MEVGAVRGSLIPPLAQASGPPARISVNLTVARWGFIGAGNVTEVKASPIGAFTQEGSRVVAVARANAAQAEQYARANGIARAYDRVADLCADPDVNAVYISTRNH